ncbi:MAG: hypothetical protein A2W91_14475 [Bacteroidetes bacterium GWF2_38_335]|nr:MAG: hypothetical protein A2W91_14475 [Bacteroidetes bacterium GWF2_38_335]OFY79335.1 MAG: hypothetical protein A2281_16680 [Bacteroidetes bacterium RIFOXYA12_FULL_38_20]HBS85594.1 hypothetical protein [Bacteroidales bacterium]
MHKSAAIILARYDSARLPGKILKTIAGKKLLEWCTAPILNNGHFEVIIATSDRSTDDPIAEFAASAGINCFRGQTDDVAGRILSCAKKYGIDYFARVNGDSPFVNKNLLMKGFGAIENSDCDFVTNLVPRNFPYGVSVEIFRTKVYEKVYNQLKSAEHKEHVSLFFYENINTFNPFFIQYEDGNDHSIRLVVDSPEDVVLMEKLLTGLKGKTQDLKEIIKAYKQLTK